MSHAKIDERRQAFPTASPGLLILFVLLPLAPLRVSAQSGQECPNPTTLVEDLEGPIAHVRYLADDALGGREVGSAGARCAADYLAASFLSLGLEPADAEGGFFDLFPVRAGTELGESNELALGDGARIDTTSWIPFGFARSGETTATLVYGGVGISEPGNPNDPYLRLDLEGKIVVIEAGVPANHGGGSLYGDPHFKARVAAGRGAAGVVILQREGRPLPDLRSEMRPSVGIPAAAVSGTAAERVRSAARAGEEGSLSVSVGPLMVEARNVAAFLPGIDPELRHEVVVIGAHYDHLGLGGEGSLAPDDFGSIHNGADDNASGSAALLEVARILSTSSDPPARSVLFLAFTGEEKGLWGSAHYVSDPIIPLENTLAMINMDMVGRMSDRRATVFGVATAEEWTDLIGLVNEEVAPSLRLSLAPDGFGPSDHSSFYGKGIPVLHFFTNIHADYHRPTDDWELINREGLQLVADMVAGVTRRLTGTSQITATGLTPIEGGGGAHAGLPPSSSDDAPTTSGYGPYFGSIPDMTPLEFGVRLTGVREDSPAEKAGVRAGDIVVEFGGQEVSDLYAYTYALREHAAGDEVTVVVLREGERVTLTAVLVSR